jgi:signal transduction histidine kinase
MKPDETNENKQVLSPNLIKFQRLMREQVRHYSFHNDHIMRGPLCRVMGLIDLLKKENLSPDARKMIDMLQHEARQMENVTFMISKMLEDHEDRLQEHIND